jgi:hypothetical protein
MSDHNLRHVATCCCFLRLDLPQPTAVGVVARSAAKRLPLAVASLPDLPAALVGTTLGGVVAQAGEDTQVHHVVQSTLTREPDRDACLLRLTDSGVAAGSQSVVKRSPLFRAPTPVLREDLADHAEGALGDLHDEVAGSVGLGLTLGAQQHVVVLELVLLGLREACHGLLEGEHAATDAATMAGVASDPPQVERRDVLLTQETLGLPVRRHHGGGAQNAALAAAGAQDSQSLRGLDASGPVAAGGAGDGLGGGLDRGGGGHGPADGRGEDGRRGLRPVGLDLRLELAALVEQRGEPDLRGRHAQGDRGLAGGLHHREDLRTAHRDELGVHAVLGHQQVAGGRNQELVHLDDLVGLHPVVAGQPVEVAAHGVRLTVIVPVVVLEAFQEGGLLVDDGRGGLGGVEGRQVVPGPGDEVVTVGDLVHVVEDVVERRVVVGIQVGPGQLGEVRDVGVAQDVHVAVAVRHQAAGLAGVLLPTSEGSEPGTHLFARLDGFLAPDVVAETVGLLHGVTPADAVRPSLWGIPSLGERGKV